MQRWVPPLRSSHKRSKVSTHLKLRIPPLPLEVLFQILSYHIRSDNIRLSELATLSLVSKVVQAWVDPFLFCSVTLSTPEQVQQFLSALESEERCANKEYHDLGSLVRHLKITVTVPQHACADRRANIGGVLAACYALEHLTVHPSVLPYTLNLPSSVTLSCPPPTFTSTCSVQWGNVTNLRLCSPPFSLIPPGSFPALTHIAIDFPPERAREIRPFLEMIRHLLRCAHVQVIAILVHCLGVRMAFENILAGILDERLIAVELSGRDAISVGCGKSSVWDIVDKAIHEI